MENWEIPLQINWVVIQDWEGEDDLGYYVGGSNSIGYILVLQVGSIITAVTFCFSSFHVSSISYNTLKSQL